MRQAHTTGWVDPSYILHSVIKIISLIPAGALEEVGGALVALLCTGTLKLTGGREPPPNDRFCLVNVRKVHGRIGVRIDKIGHSSVLQSEHRRERDQRAWAIMDDAPAGRLCRQANSM